MTAKNDVPASPGSPTPTTQTPETPLRWLESFGGSFAGVAAGLKEHYRCIVEPCIIKGRKTLVFERGLRATRPKLFTYLKRFADENGLSLHEDRRTEQRPVKHDRRAKWAPILALAAGMLAPGAAGAGVAGEVTSAATSTGPAAVSKPPGAVLRPGTSSVGAPVQVTSLLQAALEARIHGAPTPVDVGDDASMPSSGPRNLVRYDHAAVVDRRTHRVSYFEGDRFHALGIESPGAATIEVLLGGGPRNAPKLWTNFEQALHDSVEVHLFSGDPERDDFGLLKASYDVALAGQQSVLLPSEIESAPAKTGPLPIRSDDPRALTTAEDISTPEFELDTGTVFLVALAVRRAGRLLRADARRTPLLPDGGSDPAAERYDHRFQTARGEQRFSYFEGQRYCALGYHYEGQIILDVLDDPSRAPVSLLDTWNPSREVLTARLLVIAPEPGPTSTTWSSRAVADLPRASREAYTRVYCEAVRVASTQLASDDGKRASEAVA